MCLHLQSLPLGLRGELLTMQAQTSGERDRKERAGKRVRVSTYNQDLTARAYKGKRALRRWGGYKQKGAFGGGVGGGY